MNIKAFSKFCLTFCILPCIYGPYDLHAAEVVVSGIPTNWRLQEYQSASGVVLWFTGSSCANGLLTLNNPTESQKNRLYALVLSAKITSKPIFIYYENASGAVK